MANQGVFTLPPNINFGITAFTNSSAAQTITVLVDNVSKATFTGSGASDKLLGTKVVNSGKGAISVTVNGNNKASDLVSAKVILGNESNFVVLGSEDYNDNDDNDGIVILNWPLG